KAPTTAAGDSSPLQLRVERANGELLLTWNRDTDAIRNATKATLQITDGEQHENVDMDLAQLRNNGSIVYSPNSADVSFTMEVIGRDQTKTTSERVRVLRTRPSPFETQAENKPAAPATTPAPAPAITQTPVTPAKNGPKQTTRTGPAEDPAPQEPPKQAPQHPGLHTPALPKPTRPATPTDIPEAPTAGPLPASVPGVNLPASNLIPGAPVAPP